MTIDVVDIVRVTALDVITLLASDTVEVTMTASGLLDEVVGMIISLVEVVNMVTLISLLGTTGT